MCKSICSPAPQAQTLCDFQSDAKSELRLEDAKWKLGQGFVCLPMRWIWDKSRVCTTHSCCILCKSIRSPAPQPQCDFQSDAKSELRLEDAKWKFGQVFLCLPMRWIWDKSRVCTTHSCCIMCKSICSPAPQPLCDFQSDAKSELRLEDAKYGLGQGFLCLPMRWIWDKSKVFATHSCCIMCKSICSPAPQPLCDFQSDAKSELRLEDAKYGLGQGFLCLPLRWIWDKSRVFMTHSCCIMCKSICSPAPQQPQCDFQSDAKSELRLEDAKYGLGQGFWHLPMRWIWDKSRVFMTQSCCILCKSIRSPAPQPLCVFQSDAKSELSLEDAKYGLGQGFLCLALRWIWDKSRVCTTHSCCIMCKSICSPAPQAQTLCDFQSDAKSELRLEDAKWKLGQGFVCLPMRWIWDKSRVCTTHSCCILCKSIRSPAPQPQCDFQSDAKSELRLEDAKYESWVRVSCAYQCGGYEIRAGFVQRIVVA